MWTAVAVAAAAWLGGAVLTARGAGVVVAVAVWVWVLPFIALVALLGVDWAVSDRRRTTPEPQGQSGGRRASTPSVPSSIDVETSRRRVFVSRA